MRIARQVLDDIRDEQASAAKAQAQALITQQWFAQAHESAEGINV